MIQAFTTWKGGIRKNNRCIYFFFVPREYTVIDEGQKKGGKNEVPTQSRKAARGGAVKR